MPPPSVPGAPRLNGSASQSRGPNFLRVEWDEVPGATSYEVRTSSGAMSGIPAPAPPPGTVPTLQLTGLAVNSLFEVAVNAINADGASGFGPSLNVFTRPATPLPPFLVGTNPASNEPLADVPARGSNRLRLDWTPVDAPSADLLVNADPPRRDVTPGTDQAGLDPNTAYTIRLVARDDARGGESFPSTSREVRSRPPTPANFARSDFDPFFEGILLTWDAVPAFPGSGSAEWTVERRGDSNGAVDVAGRGGLATTSLVDLEHPRETVVYRIVLAVGANRSLPSPSLRVEGVTGSHIGLNLAPRPGESPGLPGLFPSLGGMSLLAEGHDAGDGSGDAGGEAGGDEGGGDEGGGDEAGGDEAGGDEAGGDEAGGDEAGGDPGAETETKGAGERGSRESARADSLNGGGDSQTSERPEKSESNEGGSGTVGLEGAGRPGSSTGESNEIEGSETGQVETPSSEQPAGEPASTEVSTAESSSTPAAAAGDPDAPPGSEPPSNVLVSETVDVRVTQPQPGLCVAETGGESVPFQCDDKNSTYTVGSDGTRHVVVSKADQNGAGYELNARTDDQGNRTVEVRSFEGSETTGRASATFDRNGNLTSQQGDFNRVARGEVGYEPKAIDPPGDTKGSGPIPLNRAPTPPTEVAPKPPTRPPLDDPKAPPRPDRVEKDGREPTPEAGSGMNRRGAGETRDGAADLPPEPLSPKERPGGRGPGNGRDEREGHSERSETSRPSGATAPGGVLGSRGGVGLSGAPLDGLIQGLDLVGFIPGPIGTGASLLQAGLLSFVKQDYVGAGIALAGAIPFVRLARGARAGIKGTGTLAGKYFVRAEFMFTTKTYSHAFRTKLAQLGTRALISPRQIQAIGAVTPTGKVYARFFNHELQQIGTFRVGSVPRSRMSEVLRATPSNTQRGNMLEKDIREVFERFFDAELPTKHPSATGADIDLLRDLFQASRRGR